MTQIQQEILQYPETGIVNPFTATDFCLTDDMRDFLDGFLLVYRDYPDAEIVREFAERFGVDVMLAEEIEHAYVVTNRTRIYQRVGVLRNAGKTREEMTQQLCCDFGLDKGNAERYVRRAIMDGLDNIATGCFMKKEC